MLKKLVRHAFSSSAKKELPPGAIQVKPSCRDDGARTSSAAGTNWNRVSGPEEIAIKAGAARLLGPSAAVVALERFCPDGAAPLLEHLEQKYNLSRNQACAKIAEMAAEAFMESTQGRESIEMVKSEKQTMAPPEEGIVCEENVVDFPKEWAVEAPGRKGDDAA